MNVAAQVFDLSKGGSGPAKTLALTEPKDFDGGDNVAVACGGLCGDFGDARSFSRTL